MAKIMQCDRCKRAHASDVNYTKLIRATFHESDVEAKFDLCGNCSESLDCFMRNESVSKEYSVWEIIR